MSADRVVDLEGVHNFRDYGGYAVSGGGRLKRGVLWRSGQHNGATDSDLERIAALNLATVFDLRTSKERKTHPCRRPAKFAAQVHFAEDPTLTNALHLMSSNTKKREPMTAAQVQEGMRRNYGKICFRPELLAILRIFFAELAEGRGPSLVNCMAGKDRTGIAVAMLHLAAGVHRDDAIADYVLTNSAGDVEARIASGAQTIREMNGTVDIETVRVIMGVEAEYLESALTTIAEKHGSIDGYLAEALGVDDRVRGRLRDALVEG